MLLFEALPSFTKFRGQRHEYYLFCSFKEEKGGLGPVFFSKQNST